MPHYKNGELIHLGDIARGKTANGQEVIGPVAAILPDTDMCNIEIVVVEMVRGDTVPRWQLARLMSLGHPDVTVRVETAVGTASDFEKVR